MTTKTRARDGREFELAEQDRVDALEAEIARIVEAFGHDPAGVLTTDESTISHIAAYEIVGPYEWRPSRIDGRRVRVAHQQLDRAHFDAACAKLGLVLAEDDLIVDVALRLRQIGRS